MDQTERKMTKIAREVGKFTVQTMKEEAADYICKRYDWDNVTDRTLRLYRNQKDERALSKQFVTDKQINSEMPVVRENKG